MGHISRSFSHQPTVLTIFILALAMLTLCSTPSSATMLDSLDKAMLDSALEMIKLNPAELGFDKLWAADDTFRLAVVEKYLDDPYIFPNYVDDTQAQIDAAFDDSTGDNPLSFLRFAADQLQVDPEAKASALTKPELGEINPAKPYEFWLNALKLAEPHRLGFYSDLDSLDLHDLMMAAPGLWCDDEGEEQRRILTAAWQKEFGAPFDTTRNVGSDRVLDIMIKLNRDELIAAAVPVACAAWKIAGLNPEEDFSALKADTKPHEGIIGECLYYAETEFGVLVIGGAGDNVYSGDFAAIIDLGGNDVYHGRYGGAIGELSNAYALVVDYAGDDFYDASMKDMAQGAGFLGVGILIDKAGNDNYRAGGYAQGAGLFGVGIHQDLGGADDRRGTYFLQGAAQCGVGILIDKGDAASDDRYLSASWAQGFAGTFGYGLLFDNGGDDNYRAGGVYYHVPLLPKDYHSFSAGFGMGWRPRAGGGIGVLYDKGDGTDFYDQEVMSIGSSYWYSIGICIDGGGNDQYSLAQYGMGSGIHLSLGAFYDVSGDDQYHSRNGVVGATPHDFSVGIMVDGEGDDFYTVSDGWGGSLTNSYGLFIDRMGNDTYATWGKGYSFGKPRWARGFGGVAVFLDLEGTDVYPREGVADNAKVWIQNGWGIGIDLDRDIPTEKEAPIGDITLTAEDSAKSIRELYNIASGWEVGSARESVKRARTALLTHGSEVITFILEGPIEMTGDDISDLKGFIEKISEPKTSLGSYVNGKLSDEIKTRMSEFLTAEFEVDSLKAQAKDSLAKDVAAELTAMLMSDDFYNKKRFADVDINDEVKKEIRDDLAGQKLFQMNWHVFEQAYPKQIVYHGGRLGTRASLENRLIGQCVSAMPDTAGPMIMAKIPELLDLKDLRPLSTAISLLGEIKWEDSIDMMLDMLKNKKHNKVWNGLISSLGQIGDKRAAAPIAKFIDDDREKRRIFTIGALGSIKDSTTIVDVVGRLDDNVFTVRSSAMTTVSNFGIAALPNLHKFIDDKSSKYPELGIYSLGRIAKNLTDSTDVQSKTVRYELAQKLEQHLTDRREHVRAEAIVGLYRIGGKATRANIARLMEQEYSPVVQSAYDRMVKEAEK